MIEHPVSAALIIFDADGTLRRCTAHRGPCHSDAGQWEVIPGVKDVLSLYDWHATAAGIATNQAGISLAHRTMEMVLQELRVIGALLFPSHAQPSMFVCPHTPEHACLCRKPAPGLLIANMLAQQYRLEKLQRRISQQDILFVGDSPEDAQASARLGISFCEAQVFFGWDTPCNRGVDV